MSERVKIEVADHVATVTLNRADKRNAVDFAMFDGLMDAAASIAADKSIRVVVMHGDGPDFCAGVDISNFSGEGIGSTIGDRMKPRSPAGANYYQGAAMCWRELPVPVIAAIRGSAFGAGFQIAMGADVRYGAPDTRMSIMEIKWGIIPDMSFTVTLPNLLREDRVRELCYTGRVVNAQEAQSLGMLTELAEDPLDKASQLAAEIAGKSPDAIRAIKQLINSTWRGDTAASLAMEAELQMAVMAGPNQQEAAMANFEKRTPAFRDPA
jgi:enoyl-CoA hydratase/carnithine racemase